MATRKRSRSYLKFQKERNYKLKLLALYSKNRHLVRFRSHLCISERRAYRRNTLWPQPPAAGATMQHLRLAQDQCFPISVGSLVLMELASSHHVTNHEPEVLPSDLLEIYISSCHQAQSIFKRLPVHLTVPEWADRAITFALAHAMSVFCALGAIRYEPSKRDLRFSINLASSMRISLLTYTPLCNVLLHYLISGSVRRAICLCCTL